MNEKRPVNLGSISYGTFLRNTITGSFYVFIGNENENDAKLIQFTDTKLNEVFVRKKANSFVKVTKKEMKQLDLDCETLFKKYEEEKRIEEEQKIRSQYPMMFKKLKDILFEIGVNCDIDLDDNGNPTIEFFDETAYNDRRKLNVDSEMWQVENALENAQQKLNEKKQKEEHNAYLKNWWKNLSEEDQKNFKEIYAENKMWFICN